jgi:shikimate dehydrogenase
VNHSNSSLARGSELSSRRRASVRGGRVPTVRGTTRVVAIVGDPVAHSRSPLLHNAAFTALGLDWVYVALQVRPTDLRRAMAGVRTLGFAGLNVTVPHKERICSLLDRLSPSAREIGAVNTVYRAGRELRGENTDAPGFLLALSELAFRPRGKSVVLLGAGGSARAVGWALREAGVGRLTILNRTPERAVGLARKVRRLGGSEVAVGKLARNVKVDALDDADLVVNCTSLGLDGDSAPEIDYARTPSHCLFYDLVYRRGTTPFVRRARAAGRRAEDGSRMLLHQAALAFRIWTGREPPLAIMAKALAR